MTDSIGLRKVVAGLRPEYESLIDMAYYKGYDIHGFIYIYHKCIAARQFCAILVVFSGRGSRAYA